MFVADRWCRNPKGGIADLSALVLSALLGATCVAAVGDPAQLVSAQSRKTQGGAGMLDLPLSLALDQPTVEPRAGPTHLLVFTFDKALSSALSFVTEGTAVAGTPTIIGAQVLVPLSGVSNAQFVSLALTEVVAVDGGTGATAALRIGFLQGDADQSSVVDAADTTSIDAELARPAGASNLRSDTNASGVVSLRDKRQALLAAATTLPAVGAPANQAPRISTTLLQGVTLPQFVDLWASVTDDGLPRAPGRVIVQWSKQSGPGDVVFRDATKASTQASLSEPGRYVLRIRVDDGALTNYADVTVEAAYGIGNAGNMQMTFSTIAAPIDLLTFSSGASSTCPIGGCGGGAVRPDFRDATFSATESSVSPLILQKLSVGTHLATATAQMRSPTSAALVADWTFTDVVFSSFQIGMADRAPTPWVSSVDLVPLTTMSFSYRQIKYRTFAANGSISSSACFDVQSNTSC